MKSKTIILSSPANQSGRGILTINDENGLLNCRIRLYNLPPLNRFVKLGVYHQKQVYSANLLEKNGVHISSLVGDFDLNEDFFTALIDTKNDNSVILSGGTYAGYFFNNDDVFSEVDETKTAHLFDKVETAQPNTNLYNYTEVETETKKTDCETCEACKNCKYKEFFYSQQGNVQEKEQPKEEPKETEDNSLIKSIAPQFKYVFENFPIDQTLNALIPNGKFVKIDETVNSVSLDNTEQYSIGAIYEDDEIKYICYAVMCSNNCQPPKELGEHYQWLPLDKDDPLSDGYYIVFQDANDLKIVEL